MTEAQALTPKDETAAKPSRAPKVPNKVPSKATGAKKSAGTRVAAPLADAAALKAKPAKSSQPTQQVAAVMSSRSTKAAKFAEAPKPAKLSKPLAAEVDAKKRQKMLRDSFTMPRGDYDLIAELKQRAMTHKRVVKKSELLRAGLHALNALNDAQLLKRLDLLAPIKAGRPKKQG